MALFLTPDLEPDKEPLSDQALYLKLARYCAYQERAPAEVLRKMYQLEVKDHERQQVMLRKLEADNYLCAQRFAQAYATGKLRQNRWGQRKIAAGLAAKGVERDQISAQVQGLSADDVNRALLTLLTRRDETAYAKLPTHERRTKLMRLGISRGFEPDAVRLVVANLLSAKPTDSQD